MQKSHFSDLDRYWNITHYRRPSKFAPHNIPYKGESLLARQFEYSNFPYTYAYDVPNVITYPRSLYGRGFGIQSEYGYRQPYGLRSELFGHRYPPYLTDDEYDYYRELTYPRFSRYHSPRHYY
ncbi:uncharacterized protein LOC132719642 [Ruditapes philippinarum]|uniref:uncharacterized protein LOC132719642 n=1 Tax=Ruditapes philippinarum TaxID=129788 RepID=UPI00295AFDE8|nr:uncharacterized protein LOC132719642 [Ruditapes philippinarum]